MEKEKHPGGRPAKYTPDTLLDRALHYFETIKGVPTKAGLLLHLGITRETWSNYRDKPEFLDTLKGCEMKIEEAWTQQLLGPGAAGPIFYLKNAFKEHYRDRYENDVTSNGEKIVIAPAAVVETFNLNATDTSTRGGDTK